MKETTLNSKLVNSFREHFKNLSIEVAKMHGNQFSKSFPDVRGCLLGQTFWVEGKRGKIPKTNRGLVVKETDYSVDQVVKLKELHESLALTMTAIYIHQPGYSKGCLLIPTTSDFYQDIMNNKFNLERFNEAKKLYWCNYKKQMFLLLDLFLQLMREHATISATCMMDLQWINSAHVENIPDDRRPYEFKG